MASHCLSKEWQERLRGAWTAFFPPPKYGYNQTKREPLATLPHIIVFGLSIIMVGLNCYWSKGLAIGFYPFLGATFLVGSCAFALCCCLAEMTSALPFSGGIYGFVRLTLGPYLGFLVGFFEIFQAIVYASYYMVEIGDIFTKVIGVDKMYSPLVWLVAVGSSANINIRGNYTFWNIQWLLVMYALVIIFIFIFSSINSADSKQFINREDSPHHFDTAQDRFEGIFKFLIQASWFFSGFEMVPLTCSDAIEPKKTVAYGMLWQMGIVCILAPIIVTAACVQSPGSISLSNERLPLIFGYINNFHLSAKMASLLFVPALFQSYHAYVYVFGRQFRSMADSRLLPSILQSYHSKFHTPYVGIIVGCILSYCLMFFRLFSDTNFDILSGISSIGTIFIYVLIACSYLVFRQRYETLERYFIHPFAYYATSYALIILVFGLVGICAFVSYGYWLISMFFAMLFIITLYYFFYARHKQRFSEDEQKVFFLAYVINANRGKAKAIVKRSKSMYMSGDHNSTASTSFRSNRRISDGSNGRGEQSNRSRISPSSPENSFHHRTNRIYSPKASPNKHSLADSSSPNSKPSSPPLHPSATIGKAEMLASQGHSQDSISTDSKYTLVENLFTINEEMLNKADQSSKDDVDMMTNCNPDLVLESIPSQTVLVDDFKSPRASIVKKQPSAKKLTSPPLTAEEEPSTMESTIQLPSSQKPTMKAETKRKMMVLKMAAYGGFKESAMQRSKNRITLPPLESNMHKNLPKVLEGEQVTEFPSVEYVIARRRSFSEAAGQSAIPSNGQKPSENDDDEKDESYLHRLDPQLKSSSILRKGIMNSIKVLSSIKVVPIVNDPLFNQYTEEFVNTKLEETEKMQRDQWVQLQREFSVLPGNIERGDSCDQYEDNRLQVHHDRSEDLHHQSSNNPTRSLSLHQPPQEALHPHETERDIENH